MADPVRPLHDHALDNLRYIRETMERAGSFTSIPGWGGFVIGWSAVAASVLGHRPASLHEKRWLWIWLGDAVFAAVVAAVSIDIKRRRARVPLTRGPARRFFISYFAPIVAAAALTLVLARLGTLEAMPAVWLLLYGASFIGSGAFSIRLVPIMGAAFMAFGAVACFVPLVAGNALLGAAFGGLHIIFGWIIARNYGG